MRIPAGATAVHGDVNCPVSKTIHPFAFRTHAHEWGTVIKGYKYNKESEKIEEIAAGNPHWPQQFYPIKKEVTVNKGEYLMARCTYNNTETNRDIHIGKTNTPLKESVDLIFELRYVVLIVLFVGVSCRFHTRG